MWFFKAPLLTAAFFDFPSCVTKSEHPLVCGQELFAPISGSSRIAGAAQGSSDCTGQEHPQQKRDKGHDSTELVPKDSQLVLVQ